MKPAGGETPGHRDLKRRAVVWALTHDFRACAVEVRVPRSGFRADVAAAAVPPGREAIPGETVIFECKQARADLLRDTADELTTLSRLREVSARRAELERLVGATCRVSAGAHRCLPSATTTISRRSGTTACAPSAREEARLQAKLFGGTKFDRLQRYRCANRCYLVVAPGVMAAHEAPEGWGVLESSGDGLELLRPPARFECSPAARLALLQAIAVAGTRVVLADLRHRLGRTARPPPATRAGVVRAPRRESINQTPQQRIPLRARR